MKTDTLHVSLTIRNEYINAQWFNQYKEDVYPNTPIATAHIFFLTYLVKKRYSYDLVMTTQAPLFLSRSPSRK